MKIVVQSFPVRNVLQSIRFFDHLELKENFAPEGNSEKFAKKQMQISVRIKQSQGKNQSERKHQPKSVNKNPELIFL